MPQPRKKGSEYSDDELAAIYARYAKLKGWSTDSELVAAKVQSWRESSTGPVGAAVDFHKTGEDRIKHLGRDAEKAAKAGGGCAIVLLVAGTLLATASAALLNVGAAVL